MIALELETDYIVVDKKRMPQKYTNVSDNVIKNGLPISDAMGYKIIPDENYRQCWSEQQSNIFVTGKLFCLWQ